MTTSIRQFSAFLQQLEDGRLHSALTDHLTDVVKVLNDFVDNYGGKPKATITLELTLTRGNSAFSVSPKVKVKMPDNPRDQTVFWSDRDNNLTADNPHQQSLFPRSVDKKESMN